MSDPHQSGNEPVPLGQRLLDRPFFLLVVGFLVTAVFYTVWGVVEIITLPQSPLP